MPRQTVVERLLAEHAKEDTRRFNEVNTKLDKIGENVESLMLTRTLQREQKKIIVKTATVAATVVSAAFAVLKFLVGIH